MTAAGAEAPASEGALERWLRDPRALPVLAALYVGLGLYLLVNDVTLHDEGLLTYNWGQWAREAFFPVFFYQKSKPVLAALYLPAAMLGPRPCLAVHLALASAAIPMVGATARALGQRLPNLPALVLALSPIYLFGGPSGISNVDGVLATTLALYLLIARKNDLLAGLVFGALPWVRHELVVLSAVFVVRAMFFEKSRALVVGALLFPGLYGLAGALYHGDLLWLLHYPPTTAKPMPNNPIWEPVTAAAALAMMFGIAPAAGLAFGAPWGKLSSVERALWLYAVGWLALVTLLPVWRIANFGFIPRYGLTVLPAVALLAGRVVGAWWGGGRPALRELALPCALALVWGAGDFREASSVVPVFGAYALAVVLASFGRGHLAGAALAGLTALGPLLPLKTEIRLTEGSAYLPALTGWLRGRTDRPALPIYTNSPLLALYAGGAGKLPGLDVRFLVGVDQYFDIVMMSNPANGQRAALERVSAQSFNGTRAVLPPALVPGAIPEGAWVAVRRDARLEMLLPSATWGTHLQPVEQASFRVFRYVQ